MDCREVREVAEAYASGQVLAETAAAIGAHLAQCPACRAEVEAVRRMRSSVRAAVLNVPELALRPDFARALAARLQAETVPAGIAPPEAPAGVSRRAWLAMAASALAALGVGVGWQRRASSAWGALVADVAGDHQFCALTFALSEPPLPLAEAAQRFGGKYRQLATVAPASRALSGGPLDVLDRHSCVFNGRRFVHVVLRYKAEVASLLVSDDPRSGPWPWTGAAARGALADLGVTGTFNVVSFREGPHVAFVVSALGADDVRDVADAMTGPVTSALTGA